MPHRPAAAAAAAPIAKDYLAGLSGWLALVGAAVPAMAIAMQVRHDPAMSPPQMALMTALGAILVALAIALYLPALRSPARSKAPLAGPPSALSARHEQIMPGD